MLTLQAIGHALLHPIGQFSPVGIGQPLGWDRLKQVDVHRAG